LNNVLTREPIPVPIQTDPLMIH